MTELPILDRAQFNEHSRSLFDFVPTSFGSAKYVDDELRKRRLGYVPYPVLASWYEQPTNPPSKQVKLAVPTVITRDDLRSLNWAVRRAVAWMALETQPDTGLRLAAEQRLKKARRAIGKLTKAWSEQT